MTTLPHVLVMSEGKFGTNFHNSKILQSPKNLNSKILSQSDIQSLKKSKSPCSVSTVATAPPWPMPIPSIASPAVQGPFVVAYHVGSDGDEPRRPRNGP